MLIPTIEDQAYAAYAVDDIHRAKVLLLKLKSINVTSDDDPRIPTVQDEDFDSCFIPKGRLIADDEEKTLLDARQREHKRRQWEERMRACEYVWDLAKRRLREERLWLQRRRDLEERRRAAEDAERQRVFRERDAVVKEEKAAVRARLHRNVVSCDALVITTSKPTLADSDSFAYHAMASPSPSFPTWSRRSASSTRSSSPLARSYSAKSMSDESRPVSFKDVLASINGPLFPITAEERRLRYFGRDHLRQAELLDDLLVQLDQNGGNGKSGEVEVRSPIPLPRKRRSADLAWLSSSPSSSSISTCPSLTRSSSWLSRSSESWSPSPPPLLIMPSWLKRSCPTACRICQQQRKRLSVSDSPLHYAAAEAKPISKSGKSEAGGDGRKRRSLAGAANIVMNGLGHLVDAAKQLQRAYMMAAIYHGAELHIFEEDEDLYQYSRWRPAGTRARPKDVQIFLEVAGLPIHDTTPVQYIPLVSPFPSEYPPRTELPNPLPYQIVFKPHPSICRSPFRLLDKGSRSTHDRSQKLKLVTSESPVYDGTNQRIRVVGNPAFLRLKALQNVLYERGFIWEGRGSDCGLSSGKETLQVIATEGLGGSLLSVC